MKIVRKKATIVLIATLIISITGFSALAMVKNAAKEVTAATLTSSATVTVPTATPTPAAPTAAPTAAAPTAAAPKTAAPTVAATAPKSNLSSLIGIVKVNQIVLDKVPGSTIIKFELDYDDGRQVYEVKAVLGQMEYEFEINALTGAILEFETDEDDKDTDEENNEDKNVLKNADSAKNDDIDEADGDDD